MNLRQLVEATATRTRGHIGESFLPRITLLREIIIAKIGKITSKWNCNGRNPRRSVVA